ncbi:MAG: DNA-binding response OmpR family regulator [Natrialbaceae archaeon]|jgi:DNA-binding response OmpR family regulator
MGKATILVVDDEKDLADLYAMWIDEQYDVITAYSGEEALEKMDESVHIVLLDRRMPDLTGDVVLERIREQEYEARIVMVTAVDPGLDIIELEFDDYLTKPVSRPKLNRVIENMRIQLRRSGALMEHASVSNKMAALEEELDPETLEDSEEYNDLQSKLLQLGDSLTDGLEDQGGKDDDSEGESETPEPAKALEELSEGLEDL